MPDDARSRRLVDLGLSLVPAHDADPAAVLRFESENRDHFRRWIPDRGEAYYDLEAVAASLRDARRAWTDGTDRLHVIIDGAGDVVGRVNLVDIADGRASLGYRVAASHGGRGVATAAVKGLLSAAVVWGIRRVRAVTSTENVGSTRVLERCGFTLVGTERGALELGERTLDALVWELRITPRLTGVYEIDEVDQLRDGWE